MSSHTDSNADMDADSAALIASLLASDMDDLSLDNGIGCSYHDYEQPMTSYERQLLLSSPTGDAADAWENLEDEVTEGLCVDPREVKPWVPEPAFNEDWEDEDIECRQRSEASGREQQDELNASREEDIWKVGNPPTVEDAQLLGHGSKPPQVTTDLSEDQDLSTNDTVVTVVKNEESDDLLDITSFRAFDSCRASMKPDVKPNLPACDTYAYFEEFPLLPKPWRDIVKGKGKAKLYIDDERVLSASFPSIEPTWIDKKGKGKEVIMPDASKSIFFYAEEQDHVENFDPERRIDQSPLFQDLYPEATAPTNMGHEDKREKACNQRDANNAIDHFYLETDEPIIYIPFPQSIHHSTTTRQQDRGLDYEHDNIYHPRGNDYGDNDGKGNDHSSRREDTSPVVGLTEIILGATEDEECIIVEKFKNLSIDASSFYGRWRARGRGISEGCESMLGLGPGLDLDLDKLGDGTPWGPLRVERLVW